MEKNMSHDYKKEMEETKELIEKLEATSSKVAEAIDKLRGPFKNAIQFSPESFLDYDLEQEWREDYTLLDAYEEVSKSFDNVLSTHYQLHNVITDRIREEENSLDQLSEWYREEMEDKLRQGEVL
jgi:archaellum component FlaC